MKHCDNKNFLKDFAALYTQGWPFFLALGLAFICLRMAGAIAWGWQWVIAPLWAPAVFFVSAHSLAVTFESVERDHDE